MVGHVVGVRGGRQQRQETARKRERKREMMVSGEVEEGRGVSWEGKWVWEGEECMCV